VNSLLLVAATCMMGQVAQPVQSLPATTQPPVAQTQPATAAPAGCAGQSQNCCNCAAAAPCGCCDRPGLLQRLRARFSCLCAAHNDCNCTAVQKPACPCAVKKECPCAAKNDCPCSVKACPDRVDRACGLKVACPCRNDCPCAAKATCGCAPKLGGPCPAKNCCPYNPCNGCSVQQVTKQTAQPGVIHPRYVTKIGHAPDFSSVTGQLMYLHIDGGVWVLRYASFESEDRFGGSVVLAASASMHNFREGDLVTVRGEILNEGRASRYLGGPLYRASTVEMMDRAD
jgi:hypothetical protein